MGIYGRLDAAARRDLLKEVSLDKKYYKEQIQNILYDNYVKLALVNIDTGEYVSVISVDKNADDYKSKSRKIMQLKFLTIACNKTLN